MCDRGASYAVKQMRYSRCIGCGIAVASVAVRCLFHPVRFILWMKEKYTLVW